MELVITIKNGINETIQIDDSVYEALVEYSKAKNISIDKCLEIICIEYAKAFENDVDFKKI